MFSWISSSSSVAALGARSRRFFRMAATEGVGPGAEHQRSGAGGIDPFGAIALDQAQDADAGAEAPARDAAASAG